MPENGSARLRVAVGVAAAVGAVAVVVWWRQRKSSALRISKLCVYPIKSCKAINVKRVKLTSEGLEHDREYVVVKVVDGFATARTIRNCHELVKITPEMPTAEGIKVHKKGMKTLVVPILHGPHFKLGCDVWDDIADGMDQGDEAAAWFCEALQETDVRFVRFTGCRPTPQPEKFGEGLTKFSDGFGMLLTSEASLMELGCRCGLDQIQQRMRPNIVIDGCGVHEEDNWSLLSWQRGAASALLKLPKPCARCEIPRVNPTTGIPDPDPLKAMRSYRSGHELEKTESPHRAHYESHKSSIFFGQNANATVSGEAVLHVGDSFTIEAQTMKTAPTPKPVVANADQDLERQFQKAVDLIKNGKPSQNGEPSNGEKLRVYGLYKQALQGDNKQAQPWQVQLEANAKWTAWEGFKGKSKEDAMRAYVETVDAQIRKYGIDVV